MKKFNYADYKNEIKARIPALEKAVELATAEFNALRIRWKESGYSDEGWEMFREADNVKTEAEWELRQAQIMAQDVVYCNQHFYTDIKPWEVIGMVNEKTLILREMKAEITPESKKDLHDSFVAGGFCGHFDNDLQEWDITSDLEGTIVKVRLHKDGCYRIAGDKGTRFHISDKPTYYYDYNF